MDKFTDYASNTDTIWHNCYKPSCNAVISTEDIASSSDCQGELSLTRTLLEGVRMAEEKWPNTLRMLEDA